MSKFQKFQFDNFIIDDETPQYEESWENNHIHIEDEQEEVLEDFQKEPEPEEITKQEKIQEEPKEDEQIITYREDEVLEKEKQSREEGKQEGYQEGYQKGFQEASQAKENMHNMLLENIEKNFKEFFMFYKESEEKNNFENNVIEVCKEIIQKVIPVMEQDTAKDIIADFLNKNFSSFKSEAKLSFYTHPDNINYMQEVVLNLARKYDFEGKISLHKDDTMSISDCRVLWDNGGIERNSVKTLDKITKILDSNETQKS